MCQHAAEFFTGVNLFILHNLREVTQSNITEQGGAGFSPGLPDSWAHVPHSPASGIARCCWQMQMGRLCGTRLWRTPAPMECLCAWMWGEVLHVTSGSMSGISNSRDDRWNQDRDWVKHKHLSYAREQIWLLFTLWPQEFNYFSFFSFISFDFFLFPMYEFYF